MISRRSFLTGSLCLAVAPVAAKENQVTFTRYSDRPIMWPTHYWEGQMVTEPNVILEADGTFTMFYSGGNGSVAGGAIGIGMAKSEDGIEWTKNTTNPVLGQGRAVAAAAHSFVRKVGSDYHCYFSDGQDIRFATSADGRLWTVQATPALSRVLNGVQWTGQVANSWVYDQQASGAICMFFDYLHSDGIHWKMGWAYSTNGPGGPFVRAYGGPAMQLFTGLGDYTYGAMHGVYDPVTRDLEMFYLATRDGHTTVLPNDIFRATVNEWGFPNWTRDAQPILSVPGNDWEWDQTAEPFLLPLPDGRRFLYYAGNDNRPGVFKACIGLAIQPAP